MTDPHCHHRLLDVYVSPSSWHGLCYCGITLRADTEHDIYRVYLTHLYANDKRDVAPT